jgi:hypothetical protein
MFTDGLLKQPPQQSGLLQAGPLLGLVFDPVKGVGWLPTGCVSYKKELFIIIKMYNVMNLRTRY